VGADEDDSLLRALAAAPPVAPPVSAASRMPVVAPPPVAESQPAPARESLRMRRLTLTFDDPTLERAYRDGRPIRWRSFAIGMGLGGVLFLASTTAVIQWLMPEVHFLTFGIAGTSATALAPLLALLVPPRARRRVIALVGAVVALILGGGSAVLLALVGQPAATLATVALPVLVYNIYTFFNARFIHRVAVAWLLASAWFLVLFGLAPLSRASAIHITFWVLVAQLFGMQVSYATERLKRRNFLQLRIIEQERAKSERLEREAHEREVSALSGELRRQVAERSRGLSEALARLSETSRAPARLAIGDVIEGRYRVVRAIGSGGMGQVHEVERLADGKRLALKTMTGVAHKDALARFAREAQVAAELEHPNVVAAVDVDVTQTGTLFVVMELVAGGSLAAARARYGDARWALPVLRQIAAALSAMHARGIVHRDLKPANILLDRERVKVADFGLAGLVDAAPLATTREGDEPVSPLTRTGAIMGTPLYMAPEMAGGARGAGPSADVFSLGVVAYELLSKELPFAAPPVLERLSGRAVPTPKPLAQARPDLPSTVTALVDRCLADEPAERPGAEQVVVTLAGAET
jgi:hypothetical protein